jgi:hypothetical protein
MTSKECSGRHVFSCCLSSKVKKGKCLGLRLRLRPTVHNNIVDAPSKDTNRHKTTLQIISIVDAPLKDTDRHYTASSTTALAPLRSALFQPSKVSPRYARHAFHNGSIMVRSMV